MSRSIRLHHTGFIHTIVASLLNEAAMPINTLNERRSIFYSVLRTAFVKYELDILRSYKSALSSPRVLISTLRIQQRPGNGC